VVQQLDSIYENDFHDSVSSQELCSTQSLSTQQLEVAISPLLAAGLVEKVTSKGYISDLPNPKNRKSIGKPVIGKTRRSGKELSPFYPESTNKTS